MFTGMIEEIGRIRSIKQADKSAQMTIEAHTILNGMQLGDSIAVSGPCLTVVAFDASSFTVDISPETLRATLLGEMRSGDPVNLERAMQAGGRFGGHMVSGHIDGIGALTKKREEGNALVLTFSATREILDISIPKGSIAVDGISLTINDVSKDSFSVSIIPHTARMTTLGKKGIGGRVNLESDLIGKYVERILSRKGESRGKQEKSIDTGFLSEHGFM
jgi:riboflavin synthase